MSPKLAFKLFLGLLGLIGLAGGAAYYFADQTLQSRAQEISYLKADLDILELKISNARNAEAALEELSFINDIAAEVIPPDKVQSNIVAELSRFGAQAGVTIDSISFNPTGSGPGSITQTEPLAGVNGVNVLPITVSLKGSYNQILGFLKNIEQNRRKMQVDSISLSPTPDGISSSLQINVYLRT